MKLPVLSHSAVSSFQTCPRMFYYDYVERRPQFKTPEMTAGIEFHKAIESWRPDVPVIGGKDPLTRGLLRAYHRDRSKRNFTPMHHEVRFDAVMGGTQYKGFIDCLGMVDGELMAIERKTTGLDLDTFVMLKELDMQPTMYYVAAKELGYDVKGVVIDVLQRPRRNKSDSDQEFEDRVANTCQMRWQVLRKTDSDVTNMLRDLEAVKASLDWSAKHGWFPRSPGSCFKFNKICPHIGSCR